MGYKSVPTWSTYGDCTLCFAVGTATTNWRHSASRFRQSSKPRFYDTMMPSHESTTRRCLDVACCGGRFLMWLTMIFMLMICWAGFHHIISGCPKTKVVLIMFAQCLGAMWIVVKKTGWLKTWCVITTAMAGPSRTLRAPSLWRYRFISLSWCHW